MTVDFQPDLVGTVTNRCQKLLDRIPLIAWLMTDLGEVIAVNQQWDKYVEQHDLTKPAQITEILYGEDLQPFFLAWTEAKELQDSLEKKLRLKSISGDGEWFQIEIEPEIDEFAQVTWIGTATRLGGQAVFPNQYQSTQFLEALLDYASDGIVACDANGQLVLFNRAAQSFHGLPPEPIDPEEWANYYDLYDSDGRNILAKSEVPLFQALEEKTVVSQEMMIKSKQGRDRSLLASGAAIYSTAGEKLGAVVLMRDITEYKRAMTALQQSEQKFKAIFDGVFQFIGLTKTDGTLIEANLTALRFGGIRAEEAIGRLFWEVPGWIFSPATRQLLKKLTAKAAEGEFVRCEVELTGADNRLAVIDFSLMPIRNEHNDVTMLIPEGRDISQLRQAETDRNRAEYDSERLSTVLKVAKAGAWIWDFSHQKIFWTREFEILFDYEPGSTQQIYSEWLERLHPEDRERAESALQDTIDHKLLAYRCEYRIIHRDGQIRWIDAIGDLHYDDQGNPQMSGLIHDITERKELELLSQKQTADLQSLNSSLVLTQQQLKKQNEELDSFVHMVSHDLKSPLRSIANLSIWIEEDLGFRIEAGSQQQLLLMRQRIQRMDNLIDGLLRYSKVGRQVLEEESVDVAQLLSETIDSISPPKDFDIDISSPLPVIMARRILLSQVFANLLSNAIKHHDRANGLVTISAKDLGDRYQFSIADDGPGIPNKEDQKRIFEVFQTLKPSTSNENTGIGLALVKKIVEGEGGQIWLDNQQFKGTCFCFTWVYSNPGLPEHH
jgi:PAS domain S-box-containing protein